MNKEKNEAFHKSITIGLFLCLSTGVICISVLNKVIQIQRESITLINQLWFDSKLPFEAAGINIMKAKNGSETNIQHDALMNIYTETLKHQVHHTFDNYKLTSIDYSDIEMSCKDYTAMVLNTLPVEFKDVKLINHNCN